MSYGTPEEINAYFRYLGDFVGADTTMNGNYWMLLKKLNSIEFYWTVNLDDNRAEAGEILRKKFFYESHHWNERYDEFIFTPCSVLEVMVALAISMESLLAGVRTDSPDNTPKWFWMMIRNLGLMDCTDDNWSAQKEAKVRYVIGNMLDRNYTKNGEGGLFPVPNSPYDFRHIDLWRQMITYIHVNGLSARG